jgi:hypothetical protein
MRLVGQHIIDRYRSIFGDGLAAVTMAAGTAAEPMVSADAALQQTA